MKTEDKAFIVRDETTDLGSVVMFHHHGLAAKRLGARELGADYDDVSVCRAPQFDPYCPGPVPVQALVDEGWSLPCAACGQSIPSELIRIVVGDDVFCSEDCRQSGPVQREAAQTVHDRLREELRARAG